MWVLKLIFLKKKYPASPSPSISKNSSTSPLTTSVMLGQEGIERCSLPKTMVPLKWQQWYINITICKLNWDPNHFIAGALHQEHKWYINWLEAAVFSQTNNPAARVSKMDDAKSGSDVYLYRAVARNGTIRIRVFFTSTWNSKHCLKSIELTLAVKIVYRVRISWSISPACCTPFAYTSPWIKHFATYSAPNLS